MSQRRTAPQLAIDTCARRLGGVEAEPLRLGGVEAEPLSLGGVEAEPLITWHGPAILPADRPASEATVQALSGLMAVNGRDGGGTRRLGLEVASVAAGILAAQGAIAAAIARRRGHAVPVVQTSVLQAALLLMSHYFVVATGLDDAVPGPPLPAPGPPFRSADGHWFEIETLDAGPWQDFWPRLGVGTGTDLGRAWTQFRWRYERATCSLPAELHRATQVRTLAELREAAVDSRVSLAVVRDYRAVLADRPPAFAALVDLAGGGGGPARPPGGSGDLPLAGIRMVEATSRIQGPFAGMLLRMLGAEVVRIQPPEGDYGRAALTLHRGKEAVTLDLGAAGGRADLVELVAGADVFLHNWRPGKAAEWGMEPVDLARRRPGLVYASTSGWGDRPEGRQMVGTDFLVQAHAAVGDGLHPEGEPAFPSRLILCDLFGALVAAEGILAGLDRSQVTGQACEVRSSLLAGAMALQTHVLDAMAAGTEDGRRAGRPVWTSLDNPIPTADGDVVLSAGDEETCGILRQVYLGGRSGGPRNAEVERGIHVRIRESIAATEEKRLLDAGIPAAVVCQDLAEVPADPRFAGMFEPVGIGDAAVAPRTPWAFR